MSLVLAAVLAAAPGRAATVNVTVLARAFDPIKVTTAVPGDVISWSWASGGHHIKAYAGDTFDSGPLGGPATFSDDYPGGTVRYRCMLHSSLDGYKQCSGMCGYITDDPNLDIVPPTVKITSPRQTDASLPEVVTTSPEPYVLGLKNDVTIAGEAADDVLVGAVALKIYGTDGKTFYEGAVNCVGCGASGTATWSLVRSMLPGSYVLEALTADSSGNVGKSSRVHIIVV